MSTRRSTSGFVSASAFTLISTSSRSTLSVSVRSITLMTEMSLLSLLRVCSIVWSWPEVTIVMRETVGSSVSATVSDSMLNPLPENRPATRLKTPNSFSTRTDMVWRIDSPPARSNEQHLREGRPRGHHRVDHLVRIRDDVDEGRAGRGESFPEDIRDLPGLGRPESERPVGFGQADEIGHLGKARMGKFPLEEQLLT